MRHVKIMSYVQKRVFFCMPHNLIEVKNEEGTS